MEREDRDLEELMKKFKLKEPPADMMKDYAADVRRRIDASRGPSLGLPVVLAVAAAGVALAGILLYGPAVRTFRKADARLQEPAAVTAETRAPMESAESETQKQFESILDDLFILQALGEDAGLPAEMEHLETDMDYFETAGA